jgi:hypothetical protein
LFSSTNISLISSFRLSTRDIETWWVTLVFESDEVYFAEM